MVAGKFSLTYCLLSYDIPCRRPHFSWVGVAVIPLLPALDPGYGSLAFLVSWAPLPSSDKGIALKKCSGSFKR